MADSIRLNIDDRALMNVLGKVLDDAVAALPQAMDEAAEVIEEAAAGDAPGPHIARELIEVSPAHVIFHVGPDADHWYYRFFETGTSAHLVTPQTKRALKLYPLGAFAAEAVAGGMSARPFLRPAIDTHSDKAADAAGAVLKAAIGG